MFSMRSRIWRKALNVAVWTSAFGSNSPASCLYCRSASLAFITVSARRALVSFAVSPVGAVVLASHSRSAISESIMPFGSVEMRPVEIAFWTAAWLNPLWLEYCLWDITAIEVSYLLVACGHRQPETAGTVDTWRYSAIRAAGRPTQYLFAL